MESVLDLVNQHARKLSILMTLLLAVWIGVILAQGALFVLSEQTAGVTPMAPPSPQKSVSQAKAPRIDVAALNLFGEVDAEPAAVVVDAPRTSLNLQLLGVFSATDPKRASAIVSEVGKQGLLYKVGEKMPGNATLSSVHVDHILIKRGGRLEKLAFPEIDVGGSVASQTPARVNSRATSNRQTASSSSRLEQIPDRLAQRRQQILSRGNNGRDPGTVLRSYINDNRDVLQQNPGEVLSQLGVSPVADGEAQGYRIGNEVASDVLTRAGLMRGDVILSVNGQPVGNMSTDQALIDQVMAQKRVRVGVQRNQRKFYLTVPIP
ncbi:MAG: type II secretion system protein N [Pseudomonadota bacterium]